MVKLTKIGVLSLGKFQAIFMFIFGLIFAIFYVIIEKAVIPLISTYSATTPKGIGFLALILFPVIYAIIGFVTGVIMALLYNLISKFLGGIDLEFEEDSLEQDNSEQEVQEKK